MIAFDVASRASEVRLLLTVSILALPGRKRKGIRSEFGKMLGIPQVGSACRGATRRMRGVPEGAPEPDTVFGIGPGSDAGFEDP